MLSVNTNNFKITSVRALNFWRPLFLPTYLGLRIFLNQLDDINLDKFLYNFLFRKVKNRQLPRYRKFFQFKGKSDEKNYIYREFFAASPTSAISEAYCLKLLSTITTLENRKNVYSYRWPQHDCDGRCFSYFFSGYKERRDNVTEMLKNGENYTVFVYDIKKIYPSIDKEIIRKRLANHLEQLHDENDRAYANNICNNILNICNNGIPVGPAPAHIFGNIALEIVDKYMTDLLGNRYLRYVDDIFLVLKNDESKKVHNRLTDLIESEGLKLHENKYDEMSKDDWLTSISGAEEEQLSLEFDSFIQRIKLFLWWKAEKFEEIESAFKELAIPIPLKRFFIDSQYGRFHRFMHGILRTTNWGLKIISQLHKENPNRLSSEAIQLRKTFQRSIENLLEIELPKKGMKRRWIVQKLRFLLNRLIYLTPINDYKKLLYLAPEVEEFYEYRVLVKSIIDKNIDEIIKIPGAIVSTFASVCQHSDELKIKAYDPKLFESKGAFESFCILSLYGIVDPPKSWIEKMKDNDSELMNFCRLSISSKRMLKDFSFEDEVRTLQLGTKKNKIKEIFDTRYSDQEAIILDGLLLSKYGAEY